MNGVRSFISCFLIILLFSGCDFNRIYEKNVPIPETKWNSSLQPAFAVQVRDTSLLYNLFLNIRHDNSYPYENIWLNISVTFPDSSHSTRRMEVMLAKDDGEWFGTKIGSVWDYRTLLQQKTLFKQSGTYTFYIQQDMREDPLPGMLAVGLRLENTGIKHAGRS